MNVAEVAALICIQNWKCYAPYLNLDTIYIKYDHNFVTDILPLIIYRFDCIGENFPNSPTADIRYGTLTAAWEKQVQGYARKSHFMPI